jgi:hypothetical protein
MERHARWLFGCAALFNFAVAATLVFLRAPLGPLIGLERPTGSNVVLANVTGALVATFGFAYVRVARAPVKYRAYVSLAMIGKSLVVVAAVVPWIMGAVDWRLPALAGADAVFTGLFGHYLRRWR